MGSQPPPSLSVTGSQALRSACCKSHALQGIAGLRMLCQTADAHHSVEQPLWGVFRHWQQYPPHSCWRLTMMQRCCCLTAVDMPLVMLYLALQVPSLPLASPCTVKPSLPVRMLPTLKQPSVYKAAAKDQGFVLPRMALCQPSEHRCGLLGADECLCGLLHAVFRPGVCKCEQFSNSV